MNNIQEYNYIGQVACLNVEVNRLNGKVRISDIDDNYSDMDSEELACFIDMLKRAWKKIN